MHIRLVAILNKLQKIVHWHYQNFENNVSVLSNKKKQLKLLVTNSKDTG